MAKFDAATAVEPMEYDLSAYGGSKGTIPEPTTGALDAFMEELRSIQAQFREVQNRQKVAQHQQDAEGSKDEHPSDDQEDLAVEISEMDEALLSQAKELTVTMRRVVADLTQGQPSVEDLEKLPPRVFLAFVAWLTGEIRPKATTPGTRR